ncbi:MAG: VWA domain-containing protein, partial [Desulfobacteraceae bacterium]|nr:VWA domain-containing protein [Desulfobacteraceae bacterium]
RKAVLLINDGENNSSYPSITVDTAIDVALSEDIPVYTIGLGAEADWEALKKLSSETGGVFYASYQADDLPKDFEKLAQLLMQNQFVFTYSSSLTGGIPAPATLTVEAEYKGVTGSDTKGFTSCP